MMASVSERGTNHHISSGLYRKSCSSMFMDGVIIRRCSTRRIMVVHCLDEVGLKVKVSSFDLLDHQYCVHD